jgi:hypothetical protein
MIYFQESYLTLSIDAHTQCLVQTWKGYARSEQFRRGIEKSIELFQEQPLSSIISNTKDFAMAQKEDTDWVSAYATPILMENGLKHMAFVKPESSFGQVAVYNYKSITDRMLTIRYFVEFEHAQTWIDSLDSSLVASTKRLTALY